MVKSILKCISISKAFKDKEVLKDISLNLKEGETIALMGKSGSGKTTLLKCINFILSPNSGDAYIENQQYMKQGSPLFALHEIRTTIGMVFQDYNLFPNLTCLDNITLALKRVKQLPKNEANRIAKDIADKLLISDILKRYPNEISGGQAQRLSLARAIVLNPKVLLLDEITSALDPSSAINVMKAIKDIRQIESCQKLGIILVSHHLQFAIEFSDRLALLHNGNIIENHPSKLFQKNCSTAPAKEFLEEARLFL